MPLVRHVDFSSSSHLLCRFRPRVARENLGQSTAGIFVYLERLSRSIARGQGGVTISKHKTLFKLSESPRGRGAVDIVRGHLKHRKLNLRVLYRISLQIPWADCWYTSYVQFLVVVPLALSFGAAIHRCFLSFSNTVSRQKPSITDLAL